MMMAPRAAGVGMECGAEAEEERAADRRWWEREGFF